MKSIRRFTLPVMPLLMLSLGNVAVAQTTQPAEPIPDPILTGRPDAATPSPADPSSSDLLGERFESLSSGIEFRAPAQGTMTRHSGEKIVEFTNDDKHWILKVNRLSFKDGISMTYHQEDGHDVNGLLEETVQQLKTSQRGIVITRQDVFRTGQLDVGMIAGKYNIGSEGDLALVALVRQTPADGKVDASHVYFTFNLTQTVDKNADLEKDPSALEKDANAVSAVRMFQQVIDSIRLLDQSGIREDQDQRLFRTRSLFVNLTETRLKSVLQREQWLRLLHDGKDIGYSYIVEETGRDLPRAGRKGMQQSGTDDGVLIGVRTRTMPEPTLQVDSESWMWASFDRHHEKWSNLAIVNNSKTGKEAVGAFGSSDMQSEMVSDVEEGETYKGKDGRVKTDKNQPAVRERQVMELNVTHIGREKSHVPVQRTLPPWYISQAIGHLLPRLLGMSQGSSYMFATYNNETREVMMRYVDVDREQPVDLDGKSVRAIPIRDRLGLEGSVTIHYITSKGAYLGSVNADQKITILASDSPTIMNIWKDADLSRPKDVDQSQGQPEAAPAGK